MLPTTFQVNWLFCSEEEAKNRFQDGGIGGHLRFMIGTILATFHPQVTIMLSTKFQVTWSLRSEEAEKRFSRRRPWLPFWISHRNNLSTFDLQVTPMRPTKYQVNWSFGSGEVKNRFSDGRHICHLRCAI